MIKILQKIFIVLTICGGIFYCFADDVKPYMDSTALPKLEKFYPKPPDPASVPFMYDISQYMWGKSMRADTTRAALAIAQNTTDPVAMAKKFSAIFGLKISKNNTPNIMKLLRRGIETIDLAGHYPKNHFNRMRPYVFFSDRTLIPGEEEIFRNSGSYPSGHTIRAWTMALLLIEINPTAQDSLLAYAYEWGQSRVIAGYHWQSDVDASKIIASAALATLHTNKEFLDDMNNARIEFNNLTAKKK